MGLHKRDKGLLEILKMLLGDLGHISNQGTDEVQFKITSNNGIEILIAYLNNNPLITQKLAYFMLLKQAFELIKNKEHLISKGFQKLVNIRATINKGLTDELK